MCGHLAIAQECITLRHAFELISPGTLALAASGSAAAGRPVLFSEHGVKALRDVKDAVSRLVLQTVHEDLHVALARVARTPADSWSALGTAAEESRRQRA
jgi:hypothetical protein